MDRRRTKRFDLTTAVVACVRVRVRVRFSKILESRKIFPFPFFSYFTTGPVVIPYQLRRTHRRDILFVYIRETLNPSVKRNVGLVGRLPSVNYRDGSQWVGKGFSNKSHRRLRFSSFPVGGSTSCILNPSVKWVQHKNLY